jgi:endoglucanase
VDAVREVDADHIIFLEGDYYSTRFSKFDPPFAPNLVYSNHNYTPAGLFTGKCPEKFDGKTWNRKRQGDVFGAGEGTVYTQQNQVPLWVGEFGSLYTGPVADATYRLRALDEQIAVFEEHAAHWTIWTYKDIGVMGLATVDPRSDYLQLVRPVLRAKHALGVDLWLYTGVPKSYVQKAVDRLARYAERTIKEKEIDHPSNRMYLSQAVQAGYFASLLQPSFAKRFKGLSESQIDGVMQSFALRNCKVQKGLVEVMKKYWQGK